MNSSARPVEDRPTVLIVDDEPANLAVLNRILHTDFRVVACKTGEQALARATSYPIPDVVLLDVMMPGMGGYEVLRRLREDADTRDIPVIFVTALDALVDEEYGLTLGAVDYITKPVKPAIVRARVSAHVEIKHARDRLKDQNAWLEDEVKRRTAEIVLVQDVSLSALAQLCETRDSDTGNHVVRTQRYIEVLARELQSHPSFGSALLEPHLSRIVKAAPLHDIGKVGIPDRILLKPGKLDAEEWAIMQSHATIGGDVIKSALERAKAEAIDGGLSTEALAFFEVAEVIARGHHEKWNGRGYPAGLAGDAIPVAARLMALVDVFDAVTTPRVYKAAWSMDRAVALIREERGEHFDPSVVDAFLGLLDVFDRIRVELADELPTED